MFCNLSAASGSCAEGQRVDVNEMDPVHYCASRSENEFFRKEKAADITEEEVTIYKAQLYDKKLLHTCEHRVWKYDNNFKHTCSSQSTYMLGIKFLSTLCLMSFWMCFHRLELIATLIIVACRVVATASWSARVSAALECSSISSCRSAKCAGKSLTVLVGRVSEVIHYYELN